MKSYMTKTLQDDYESHQLNPVYSKPASGNPSHEKIKDLVDNMTEKDSVKMRLAVCEAIVDTIIEDTIAESDEPVTESQIREVVDPVVDKAVALRFAPSSLKSSVANLIANHLKREDPRVNLLEKASKFVVASTVKMEEDDTVVSEVLDDKPADIGVDVTEEVIEHDAPELEVSEDIPAELAAPMKFMAAATVNSRKATALVSRRCAGPILGSTLNQLKNCLPENFKKKYMVY